MQKQSEPHSSSVIGSIFRVRRDLTRIIKEKVVSGSGLSLEQVDLLLDLYGARYLKWPEPVHDKDGWVTFEDLKKTLAHSQALLSRKVTDLEKLDLVTTEKIKDIFKPVKGMNFDSKKKCLRITDAGKVRILPVYERFRECCDNILADMPSEDKGTLYRLNETIIKKLRRD